MSIKKKKKKKGNEMEQSRCTRIDFLFLGQTKTVNWKLDIGCPRIKFSYLLIFEIF